MFGMHTHRIDLFADVRELPHHDEPKALSRRRFEIISRWSQKGRQLMSKTKHGHHEYEGPDSEGVNHGFHRPYWKHAHHDWRLWIAVSLMLVALLTYVMTGDLAWWPRSQRLQPVAGAVVK